MKILVVNISKEEVEWLGKIAVPIGQVIEYLTKERPKK